jgi:Domain of unknown function (DUF4844)
MPMADQTIQDIDEALARLAALRAEAKFYARGFYPGAMNETDRLYAERAVDRMLDRIIVGLSRSPTKAFVLSEFQAMLDRFDSAESEEREEICHYCERVMSLLGIERSDGLLNRWLYGFNPDEMA